MINVGTKLEAEIDRIIAQYPADRKRAAVLWLMHLFQERDGMLTPAHVTWIAAKLELQPIHVWELVRFYPLFRDKPAGKYHIKLCRTVSCEMCGAKEVLARLQKKLGVGLEEVTADGQFSLSTFECLASCGSAPVLMVNDELFERLTPDEAERLIDRIRAEGLPTPPLSRPGPAHPRENRVLLANMSDPAYGGTLAEYRARGGYTALPKALAMKPADVVEEVMASQLRGRGGAGFPCGQKWKFLDQKSGKPIYLVCNADESEPGTFKDRQLIQHDPHQLLEGMLISCHAVGARTAYIYIRGEFTHGWQILQRAMDEARAAGLMGPDILGTGVGCEIFLHRGGGTYICGEETGLIESLEGKRAYPRIKPPFPAVVGLFNCPTVVNNVETLSNIPHIMNRGSAWFKGLGVAGSMGTRLLCVSGAVRRPGCFEFEMGKLTLRELIDDVCGGVPEGRTLRGVIPGGTSMPVLTADQIDVPLDFDSLRKAGTMAGSGGIIVLDDSSSVVSLTRNIAQFYAHESCGQCTPCREGTGWMEKILHRIEHGKGRAQDVDTLYDVADNIDGTTICPLGEAAAWPVKAFVKKYRADFDRAAQPSAAPAPGPEAPHA
ncbi:MAG: NADH-quinone oxidoreductase subunit NuoF [Verrucomicrobia bacterium]|nr:NADH-quinone oxidoreductase subunit NuoF [Verrucomicrobiota bacterium]